MARKNTLTHIVASAQSLAADFHTSPTIVQNSDNISYQINITTSNSIGTFAVQASNDYSPGGPIEAAANAGNWVTLTLGGGTPYVNAADDNILINLNQLPFKAVRLAYTKGTAGTGTCDILITTKQVGG